jgi:subtilisin family serine protease
MKGFPKMIDVICPNCRVITPPWQFCANCNAPIEHLLNEPRFKPLSPTQCGMDPHLHRLIQIVGDRGISKLPTASTKTDEVAVIAKVTDLDAFRLLEEVSVKAVIPPIADNCQGTRGPTWLVTARMPVMKVEEVRRKPFVFSLKAGLRLRPTLETALEASGAELPPPDDAEAKPYAHGGDQTADGNGAGVIVGIVDFGLDFLHRNFRKSDGKTRVLALWDQSGSSDPAHMQPSEFGFDYGRLYLESDINRAIEAAETLEDQSDPEQVSIAAYEALGYGPPSDTVFQVGAHGTYVTDVAAGNGIATGAPGFAPNSEIVFVELSTNPGVQLLNYSFGDSAQLVEAIQFIFKFADERKRPCVINLSVGTNGGPHDGNTLVEEAIDRLLSEKKNRAVVVAAGNSYGERLHIRGKVTEEEHLDLKWRILENDSTPNELEIWYSPKDRFTVEVIDPNQTSWCKVAPGWQIDLSDRFHGLMSVVNRLHDPNSGDNTINIFFESSLPAGEWTLRLHGISVKDGKFHAWIERDEIGQASFVDRPTGHKGKSRYDIDDEYTLSTIACSEMAIVVGSYDARSEKNEIGKTSSSGPSRSKNKESSRKPDLSAPGEAIMAARSQTLVLRNRVSGTSLAAPVVTGIVASILSVAPVEGLSATEIRDILIKTAQKENPHLDDWDRRYGHGRVSKTAAVAAAKPTP